MTNNSSPRLGHQAEQRAREARGYRPAPSDTRPFADAVDENDTLIEIKAALRRRSDGSEGRFRIFETPHVNLRRRDGRYLFVVYRKRGKGIEIQAMQEIDARSLRISGWVNSGHETEGRERQRRIPISEIFRK